MVKQSESVAHAELVAEADTTKHSHPGGGGGGLVNKTGTITTSSGAGSVTFNTPYPDTNYAIMLTAEKGSDSVIANWVTKTVNGFTITTETDRGGVANCIVFWMTAPYSNP